ncbi:MAG: hypothetical protein JWM42_3669 [Burkholderia sp.]|nr:hypothetical protein [Burkholderia sp.]
MSRVLIFPSSMAEALDFLSESKLLGALVVGASSLKNDPNAHHFNDWFYLPLVNDPAFAEAFIDRLHQHEIKQVFSPNNTVHTYLSRLIERKSLEVELLPLPFDVELERFVSVRTRARSTAGVVQAIAGEKHGLKRFDIDAILNMTDRIFGQCGEGKMSALMGAMATCPKGDVVEIGAFAGKSAAALSYLSQRLQIGPMLVVDPWRIENSVQKDAPQFVQDMAAGDYWDLIADLFLANLAPVSPAGFNYLRHTSEQGAAIYAAGTVHSDAFGKTVYSGGIAFLHIDGNHDYVEVYKDVMLWVPKMVPGGWLVLDDYCWPHGNGPRRVGDMILEQHADKVLYSFVIDGALFMQLSAPIRFVANPA